VLGRVLAIGLALVIAADSAAAQAGARAEIQAPSAPLKRYLRGVTDQQADELIAKLKEDQKQLKEGKDLYFELLSGAPASYEMNNVAPRAAFLAADFGRIWEVEHKDSGNPLWQPYRLSVIHTALGEPYWDVEVALGFYGQIEQVKMFYRPPAPF